MTREKTGAMRRARLFCAGDRFLVRPAALTVASVALCLLLHSPALADGLAFKMSDRSRFEPVREHEQIAAIHHRDGVQRMIIAVNLGNIDESTALWIFPVRGKPEAIRFDLVDEFPKFSGEELFGSARMAVQDAVATLGWAMLPCCLMMSFTDYGLHKGIVAAELTRWGLTTELIHCSSIDLVRAHFEAKGIRIREDAFKAFQPYMDGEHSLVAVRLSSKADFLKEFPDQKDKYRAIQDRWPCVFVEFPSAEVFYPVSPTAFFGDVVPMRLYVLGYVDDRAEDGDLFEGREEGIRFYRQKRATLSEHPRFFEGCESGHFSYTTISFESRGGRFARDLTLRTHRPLRFRYAESFYALRLASQERPALWLAVGIAFGLLSQLLCMLLAGKLLTGRWTVVSWWALLGIFTFTELIGAFWALCVVSRVDHPAIARMLENGGLRPKYVLLSSALWLFFLFALYELASFPLRP